MSTLPGKTAASPGMKPRIDTSGTLSMRGFICSVSYARLVLLLRVPAELAAHRVQDLAGELAERAGLEPLDQRGGDHRGGNALVHRGQDRPAALAGVGDPSGEVVQLRGPGQRVGGQVDQPGPDDRAAPPDLGDLRHVDVVLVELRVAQRRGLRV